jgi:hypothetical protein
MQLKKNWSVLTKKFSCITNAPGQGVWRVYKESLLSQDKIRAILVRNLLQENTVFYELNLFIQDKVQLNIDIMTNGIIFLDYEHILMSFSDTIKKLHTNN